MNKASITLLMELNAACLAMAHAIDSHDLNLLSIAQDEVRTIANAMVDCTELHGIGSAILSMQNTIRMQAERTVEQNMLIEKVLIGHGFQQNYN